MEFESQQINIEIEQDIKYILDNWDKVEDNDKIILNKLGVKK